jgi:hypothetical protein
MLELMRLRSQLHGRLSRFLAAFTLACALASTGACEDDTDDYDDFDPDYYDDVSAVPYDYADDEMWLADSEAALAYAYTDPFYDPFYYDDFDDALYLTDGEAPFPPDPEAAAVRVEGEAVHYFAPAGCAQVRRDEASLTYTFENCAGPLGTRGLRGTVFVTFSSGGTDDAGDAGDAGDGSLVLDVTSEDFRGNGAEVTLDFRGVFRAESRGKKRLDLRSSSEIAREGRSLTRESRSTLTWERGSQCVTLDATGTLTIDERTLDVEVDEYVRCARQCPREGTIEIEDAQARIEIEFDGQSVATVENGDGSRSQLELDCENDAL